MNEISLIIDPYQYESYMLLKKLVNKKLIDKIKVINALKSPLLVISMKIPVLPVLILDNKPVIAGAIEISDVEKLITTHSLEVSMKKAKRKFINGILTSPILATITYAYKSFKPILGDKLIVSLLTGIHELEKLNEFIVYVKVNEKDILNSIKEELPISILRNIVLKTLYHTYGKERVSKVDIIEFLSPAILTILINNTLSINGLISHYLKLKEIQEISRDLYKILQYKVEELYSNVVEISREMNRDKEYWDFIISSTNGFSY